VRDRFEKKIGNLCEKFGLSPDDMVKVARHYKYRDDLISQWYDAPPKLAIDLGIEQKPGMDKDPEVNVSLPSKNADGACLVCYDDLDDSNSFALECGHTFCKDCWVEHVRSSITQGINKADALCQ